MIRIAKTADIERICEIVSQLSPGVPHDYREANYKFETTIQNNPDYFLWVAELDGKIVGTALMHIQHKLSYHCGCAAHLEDVVVDKEHRHSKIGQSLVEEAITTAKSRGCYKIMLTCYEKTAVYYERFGFKKHDIGMRLVLKELYPQN